jgi:hypothetical protein
MHWLSEISLNAAGCWVGDLDEQALPYITFLDTSRQVLEKPKDVPFTRMCDTTGCFYHRHYDLTLDVPSRRRDLLYPNLDHFAAINGNVVTSWGDVLPSVSESTQELREFQHKSMIYTKRDESLLTLGGISQISVIPGTGCWFTRSYYMTPTGVEGYDNWQYDGYSRLKIPSGLVEKYNYGDYAMLGHRVVWALTGHRLPSTNRIVLNHMCGFRPCTNPGHIEIVHAQTNMLHRTMMRTAKNMLAGEMPIDQGVRELKTKALLRPNSDPNTVDEFWDKKAA